jgi:hypothetical protein
MGSGTDRDPVELCLAIASRLAVGTKTLYIAVFFAAPEQAAAACLCLRCGHRKLKNNGGSKTCALTPHRRVQQRRLDAAQRETVVKTVAATASESPCAPMAVREFNAEGIEG